MSSGKMLFSETNPDNNCVGHEAQEVARQAKKTPNCRKARTARFHSHFVFLMQYTQFFETAFDLKRRFLAGTSMDAGS